MNAHPPCLEWRERLALRREDLSLADRQALDAHLLTCPICTAALADYQFFEARLEALPPPTMKPLPRLSPFFFAESGDEPADYETLAASKTTAGYHSESPVRQKALAVSETRAEYHSESPVRQKAPAASETRAMYNLDRSQRKKTVRAWRALSVAVVAGLILASSLLFRQLSVSNQATHGDTQCNFQHSAAITTVAWSPNSAYIATAGQDDTVKVWSAWNCQLLNTYLGHTSSIEALAWSHDSQRLASASYDDTVQVWNALTSTSTALQTYSQSKSPVLAVSWSPNDREIASAGTDDTLRVWNVDSGTTRWHYLDQAETQTEPVDAIAWSPDGSEIATGSWNSLVQVINARTGDLLYNYTGHSGYVNALSWSPNGQYMASASNDGTVQVWQTGSLAQNRLVYAYTKHNGAVNAVSWSSNGEYIASGGIDGTVRVWNAFTGTTLKVYSAPNGAITSIAWEPAPAGAKSDELVSGSSNHTARVWLVNGL